MKKLTGISLILVILLVSLSAYLRLSHSGIGCADWPQCYGHIGEDATEQQSLNNEEAYKQLVAQSHQPMSWATPLHRLVASVLGLLVVFLNVLALRQQRHRLISFSLLILTVSLAVLGINSGSLHDPGIVMANLVGGFSMLGLLGWLWFVIQPASHAISRGGVPKVIILAAIGLLVSQIVLGGLTSANFAATSCRTIPDCHGGWWPGTELADAFRLNRKHQVTASGQAIGGKERVAIHQAHRLGALLTMALILLTGLLAMRSPGVIRHVGAMITVLILLEFSVGISAVLTGLPIALAVAHNWLAALLLLSLLKLLTLQTGSGQRETSPGS